MDNISIEDELAVVFASALLYGVYLCSLAYCLRWQLFMNDGWRTQLKRNRTTIAIVLAIFVLTTAYVSLGLFKSRTLVYDTVNKLRSSPPGIQPWYSVAIVSATHSSMSISKLSVALQCTIANTTALLVDSVLVCFVLNIEAINRNLTLISFRFIDAGLFMGDRSALLSSHA